MSNFIKIRPVGTELFPRRTERDVIKKKNIGLHVSYSLFLSYFQEMNFFDRFSKNTQMSNFIKILPVGTELFPADGRKEGQFGRTNSTNLIDALHKFANATENNVFFISGFDSLKKISYNDVIHSKYLRCV